MRPLRIGKIVDVAPVLRWLLRSSVLANQLVDEPMPMAAGPAENKDVVAVMLHFDAEANCVDGALLSKQCPGVGEFIALLELQRQRRTGLAKVCGGNPQVAVHIGRHIVSRRRKKKTTP